MLDIFFHNDNLAVYSVYVWWRLTHLPLYSMKKHGRFQQRIIRRWAGGCLIVLIYILALQSGIHNKVVVFGVVPLLHHLEDIVTSETLTVSGGNKS